MNYTITQVSKNELSALQHISKKTFVDTFEAQNDKEDMEQYVQEAFCYESLEKELCNPNSEFYFLRVDGEIAGYSKLNFKDAQSEKQGDDHLEIERIYLEEIWQGKGLGKVLMHHAIEKAKQMELNYVWLGVWEKNEKAIAFYKKIGFVIFDDHYFMLGKDVQRDLLMELKIS